MQIWAESGKSALPICNYSQILYQFLTFTQNLKRSPVICFDMMEYLKRHSSKAVKKTLSIPEWLNEAACSMGLNFSQVLQEALLQKVQSKF